VVVDKLVTVLADILSWLWYFDVWIIRLPKEMKRWPTWYLFAFSAVINLPLIVLLVDAIAVKVDLPVAICC